MTSRGDLRERIWPTVPRDSDEVIEARIAESEITCQKALDRIRPLVGSHIPYMTKEYKLDWISVSSQKRISPPKMGNDLISHCSLSIQGGMIQKHKRPLRFWLPPVTSYLLWLGITIRSSGDGLELCVVDTSDIARHNNFEGTWPELTNDQVKELAQLLSVNLQVNVTYCNNSWACSSHSDCCRTSDEPGTFGYPAENKGFIRYEDVKAK